MQTSLILVISGKLTATVLILLIVYSILRTVFVEVEKAKIRRLQELERLRQQELERRRLYEEALAKQRAWEKTPLGRLQSVAKGVSKGGASAAKGVAEGAGNVLLGGAGLLLMMALQNKGSSGGHKGRVRISGYKRDDGTYVKPYTRRKP